MLKAKIDEAEEEMDRCGRIQLATCFLLERGMTRVLRAA